MDRKFPVQDHSAGMYGGAYMKPVDIILIAVIAVVLTGAVILAVRRKKTGSCCGNCAECMKKKGAGCSGEPQ